MSADVWVLADDRAGNVSQCLGVAEATGLPFELKQIRYNSCVKLPNWLQGARLTGLDKKHSSTFLPPWPKVVIAAGRRTAPIARYIKRKSHGQTKLVHIMWPDCSPSDFDIIAMPNHDKKRHGENIITFTGSPNRVTPEKLREAEGQWANNFSHLSKPLLALIVGGSTKHHTFTPEHAADLGKKAAALAGGLGGSLLVTTSRRTGDAPTKALLRELNQPHFLHDWKQGGENPYFGFLACADAIIVTGDSMSMCSEAVATGKPVYISAPADITSEKHARLHQELYNLGWAKPLGNNTELWSYEAENPTEMLANEIKKRYFS